MIKFPKDWSEFLILLNEHRVRYALVGGYAVVYHGYVRATNDLDILLARDLVNAQRVFEVLVKFGFETPNLSVDLLVKPDKVIQLGVEPYRIDLLTGVPGITFEDIEPKLETLTINEITIPVIALQDLVRAKKAVGRARDLADIEELSKLNKL